MDILFETINRYYQLFNNSIQKIKRTIPKFLWKPQLLMPSGRKEKNCTLYHSNGDPHYVCSTYCDSRSPSMP